MKERSASGRKHYAPLCIKHLIETAPHPDGNIMFEGKFCNCKNVIDELISAIEAKCPDYEILFACESTGVYHQRLVENMSAAGFAVVVINPRFTKHEAEALGVKNSTRRSDAKNIASLVRCFARFCPILERKI